MAKDRDQKGHAADVRPPPSEGGGISTGVAIIGFVLCFFAGAAVMWGMDTNRMKNGTATADPSSAPGAKWSDAAAAVPVTSEDPMWGKRDAPVTIVVFSDFQCPFCSRVEPALEQVRTTYGPDKIRMLWKNQPLPMHPNAKPAAEAAQVVMMLKGSEAFWKFHDTAFKNQQALSAESYEKWAVASGVDLKAFKDAMAAHKGAAKVEADQQVAEHDCGFVAAE